MHSPIVIPREPASRRRAAPFLALAAVACLVLVACSPGADYPSLFPAVHDLPPPRTDTTLDSNQVQQATEDLLSARDRLSAEAQEAQGKTSTKPAAKSQANSQAVSPANPAGKSSADRSSADRSSANKSAKPAAGPAVAVKSQSIPVSAQQGLGTDAAQAAGTETK